jgi:hypothetical protein
MFKQLSILFFLILGAVACDRPLPTLNNLDLEAWRNDRNACGKYRTSTIEAIQSQKDKFLALRELQIVELLGKPDRNELYKRNQKFYYYYLLPSPDCATDSLKTTSRLAIRFNAMGLAKEAIIE